MAIVKMKKLRLIAVRAQRDELMGQLLRLGCVEVHEPEGMLSDPDAAALLKPERAGLAEARNREAELSAALKVLKRYAPEKKKLLAARPLVKRAEFLDDKALEEDLALARQVNDWESELRKAAADEVRVRDEIESLRPWEALDMPLETAGTKTCALALANVPAEVDMESVADAAEAVTDEVQIILVSSDEQQKNFLVIAMKDQLAPVLDALRSVGATPVSFPGLAGTATANIDARKRELEALSMRQRELAERIAREKDRTASLQLSADRMATKAAQAEAAERLRGTDSIVALEGWCPAPAEKELTECFKSFDCAWEFTDPAPEEYPDVPVKLKNGPIIRPMNMVTEMYSLPAYSGVDPNPLMFPFFILFYGMMMADMGYGLLMLILGFVLKKTRPRGMMDYMSGLLILGGVSTFIFGAITGGFFGDFLTQVVKLTSGKDFALPSLFTPLDDTLSILVGSMALGFVHIVTGMAVSFVRKIKKGKILDAVFEEVTWWVVFAGLGCMFLLHTNIVLYVGLAMVVVGPIVTGKGMGKITGIFGSLYNHVTGFFGDILSYSRLMALMLAGSVIAQVFNTLGAIPGNIVVFVIISMLGNALNFALNLLGCYVHDLRLQCLEFFNKFYEDGGKPFRPLDMQTKFVDIVKE